MEILKTVKQIDLADYGMEGVIVMRKPNARKTNEFYNAMGRYMNFGHGQPTLKDNAPLGDIQVATLMQYVYEAPFPTTVEGFLAFTDTMDPDASSALWLAINEGMQEVDNGGPLADSPSAETASSE